MLLLTESRLQQICLWIDKGMAIMIIVFISWYEFNVRIYLHGRILFFLRKSLSDYDFRSSQKVGKIGSSSTYSHPLFWGVLNGNIHQNPKQFHSFGFDHSFHFLIGAIGLLCVSNSYFPLYFMNKRNQGHVWFIRWTDFKV